MTTTNRSLQDLLDDTTGVVDLLRNSKIERYSFPVVAPEYHNWYDEERAWREAVVLMDQSHHMDNIRIRGRDAARLVSDTSINGAAEFAVDKAKQYIPVTSEGFVLGDGIVMREAKDEFSFVGRSAFVNWLLFHAETGGYDVEVEVDRRAKDPLGRPVTRRCWRFQIQGPLAWRLIEKVNGGPVKETKFFTLGHMNIDGVRVRWLRHGMAGAPGLEIWGPYESYYAIRATLLEAGAEFGIVPVGARAYAIASLESAWIPSPVPAIYSSEELRPYRKWLRADSDEAVLSLGGSFVSNRIEDYYLTPWDLGYGQFVKFDHDFIGCEALKAIEPATQRKKVTLAWNAEDVARILASTAAVGGPQYKYFDLPLANYASCMYDSLLDGDGELVGFSLSNIGYTSNERRVLSMGSVNAAVPLGAELQLVWGEPDGGTAKVTVESHEQTTVRVIVGPAPYASVARGEYQPGWRTAAGAA